MTQEITNFARFYALFNRLPYTGDREELKRQIVREYTSGRTESLRKMTKSEYNACCAGMEKLTGRKDEMKYRRSVCLKQMQQLGIDTADWARVDNFCRHPRIAGKPFARITFDELSALQKKLRTIARKGGLKPVETTVKQPGKTVCIVLGRHTLIN